MAIVFSEKQLEVLAAKRHKAELVQALETLKREIGIVHAKLAAAEHECSAKELRELNDLGARNGK